MNRQSNCRQEILKAVHSIIETKGANSFSVNDVIEVMKKKNTTYAESTIRTHITSRCCVNAPDNHLVVYNDFERIGRGMYRLL